MRTLDKSQRVILEQAKEEDLFRAELNYYRTHNQFPVELFGRKIINIYRNINVQVLVGTGCNCRCPFCIETNQNTNHPTNMLLALERTLSQYRAQAIEPHVSLTGGEPTLYPGRLERAIGLSRGCRTVVNTAGTGPGWRVLYTSPAVHVNLSRHHDLALGNKEIFGILVNDDLIPGRTTVQCVLQQSYIDTVEHMKFFMDHYLRQGAIGFSFRGLTALDPTKDYDDKQQYCDTHCVDVFDIANQVAGDPAFEFVQQKIGDHYWFEIYRYRGFPVRLTYSNFRWLRQIETQERAAGDWYSRATVIGADGSVYAGWAYDINLITRVRG